MEHVTEYLQPGTYVDSDAPAIVEFARRTAGGETDDVSKAIALYYAVRDSIIYTPYFDFRLEDTYRASTCLTRWSMRLTAALISAASPTAGTPSPRAGSSDCSTERSPHRVRMTTFTMSV